MPTYCRVHIADVCVYVHAHPWHICVRSVQRSLSLSISSAFIVCILLASPSICVLYRKVCFVLVFFFYCTPTWLLWIVNTIWTVYKSDRVRLGRKVATCARSCVLWSICLHRPFKPLPQSPASPLWLASAGFVAASCNVTWGIQWFLASV